MHGSAQTNSIVIGYKSTADDTLRIIAQVLAGELKKGNVKNVVVKTIYSTNEAAIVLGKISELEQNGGSIISKNKLAALSAESIGVIGNGRKVFLTGNSSLGVQQAVFKYLYLLGFRYYFPQKEWHIYPQNVNLFPIISLYSKPAFSHRRVWYAYGGGTEEVESRFAFWNKANCLGGEMNANTGHAYDMIVDRHQQEFLKHPQWLVNRKIPGVLPPNPKFDVSNPELVDFVIKDTKRQIDSLKKVGSPAYKMISLSPSDDLGTCNTKECQQLGSITDRVFSLINTVAKAIKKEYPTTKIGCLAYSEYIAPPSKPVEDNVYVSLTTAFNNSSYSNDELIGLWKKKVKQLGMYDYQALYAWDYDLPGQCMASANHTIAPTLRKYHKAGLTGYESEFNTGWINKGLGYYITSQLLWDPAANESDIKKEFFDKCFQSSALPISKLFEEWSHFNAPFISEGILGNWIDVLTTALNKEKDQQVIKRLEMIAGYLQYVIIYNKYKREGSQAALGELIEQAKMHMNDESLTYYPAMIVLGERLNGFSLNATIKENRTRQFTFSLQQTIQWLKQYRAGLKKYNEYTLAEPGKKLGPVPGGTKYNLSLHDVREDQNSFTGTTWFVFERKNSQNSFMELQADFAVGGGSKLPVQISVYPFTGYAVPQGAPLLQFNYSETKKWNRYSLASLSNGLYVIRIQDFKKGFQLKLSPDLNYSLFIPQGERLEVGYIHSLYFYVPPGTKSFRFLKTKTMRLIDPAGKEYDHVNNKQEEIEIFPTPGQSGIWRLMGVSEFFKPEGVYPVFGIMPSRMLYPQ